MLALLLTQFTHTFLIRVRACVSVCVDNIWNSSVTHHCHCNCTVYTSCVVNSLQTHTHTHTYKCTYNDFMPDLKDSKETFRHNYKTRHEPSFINEFQRSKDFNMPLTLQSLSLCISLSISTNGDCTRSHASFLSFVSVLWSERHFSYKIWSERIIIHSIFICYQIN